MKLLTLIKLLFTCSFLLIVSCGLFSEDDVPDHHFIIKTWDYDIYENQSFNVTIEFRSEYNLNNLWLIFDGEPWRSESHSFVATDIPQLVTINTSIPPNTILTAGPKKLIAKLGLGPYGSSNAGKVITAKSKDVEFHKVDNPPNIVFPIKQISYGTNDLYNDGDITDTKNEFMGNTPVVYYRVDFDPSTFIVRTKIRKTWIKDGQELFKAIQIVEGGDNAIWGKLNKNNGSTLEDGLYFLKIEKFMPDLTYQILLTEPAISSTFTIE